MQRPHHYQATVGPRHGAHPSVRNPWVDKHVDSSSSSASPSARSHRPMPQFPLVNSGPPPGSEWIRATSTSGPPPASEWLRPPRTHPGLSTFPSAGRGPSVHSSSPGVSVVVSGGGVGGSADSCGGQCAGCDAFFYHCLQVVYIAGILTGISLIIAGSVLRGSARRGDPLVLVYIGVLLLAVCTLLLSVHICVRRNVKERKRALRMARTQPRQQPTPPGQHPIIYLQEFPCQDPTDVSEFRHQPSLPRRASSRSRSLQSRRYYLEEPQVRPLEEWERQPYQPLIHRPPPR